MDEFKEEHNAWYRTLQFSTHLESSLSYTKVLSYATVKTHFEESLTTAVYLSQDKVVSWFVKSAHR